MQQNPFWRYISLRSDTRGCTNALLLITQGSSAACSSFLGMSPWSLSNIPDFLFSFLQVKDTKDLYSGRYPTLNKSKDYNNVQHGTVFFLLLLFWLSANCVWVLFLGLERKKEKYAYMQTVFPRHVCWLAHIKYWRAVKMKT